MVFHLQIKENDGFPQDICIKCIQQLNASFKFIETSKNSEQIFRNDLLTYFVSSVTTPDDSESFPGDLLQEADITDPEITSKADSKLFICSYCNSKFTYKNSMVRHLRSHLNTKSSKEEKQIDNKEVNLSDLPMHKGINHFFICAHCHVRFRNKNSLRHHIRKNHMSSKPDKSNDKKLYECNICYQKFSQLYVLDKHMEKHSKVKELIPALHQSKFSYALPIDSKKKSKTEDELFICALCDVKCTKKTSIRRHILQFHLNPKPSTNAKKICKICKICNKTYLSNSSLNRHYVYHKQRGEIIPKSELLKGSTADFECQICGKQFRFSGRLQLHVQTCHKDINLADVQITNAEGDRPRFTCTHCHAQFRRQYLLKHHILKSHIILKGDYQNDDVRKEYECQICKRKFIGTVFIKAHIDVHMQKKGSIRKEILNKNPIEDNTNKYECAVCGKKLLKWSTFNRHMKEHLKKGKQISRQSSMDRSNLVNGKAEYECPCCGMCFKTEFYYVSHTKKYHPNVDIADYQVIKIEKLIKVKTIAKNLSKNKEKNKFIHKK
jgi:hypothetical protein